MAAGKDADFIVPEGNSPFYVIRNRADMPASVHKGKYPFRKQTTEFDIPLA